MNLGEALAASAAKAPDRVAVTCGAETLTYAQFDALADRLGHGLLSAGIGQGDRVALHMGNTIEMAASYFACFKIGAIAVPLNIRLKAAEIDYVLAHSEARLYIGEPGFYQRSADTPDSCPPDRFYWVCAEPAAGGTPFSRLLQAPAREALPRARGSDPAVILYTSGTTARPKGVTHSHDSLRGTAESTFTLGFRRDDAFLGWAPLPHASGLMLQLLPAVLAATEVALVPRFDPAAILRTLERRRCTATFGLPAGLQALCRALAEGSYDVSSLRTCVAGGDSVSPALQKEFKEKFGVSIQEGIGMTEALPISANRPGRIKIGSVGPPLDGMEVRIVDDQGAPVPRGVTGELTVRTSVKMLGYWNDPAATAAAVRDGWLHTGDLVRQDEDGYCWFAGRKKEIIVRGGSNVAPQEVEDVLLQHPAVFQAGVIGVPDPELGESVIAFVSLRERGGCCERELIDFARRLLSDHKVPGKVHFLESMPLGATGKVSRRTLKEWLPAACG